MTARCPGAARQAAARSTSGSVRFRPHSLHASFTPPAIRAGPPWDFRPLYYLMAAKLAMLSRLAGCGRPDPSPGALLRTQLRISSRAGPGTRAWPAHSERRLSEHQPGAGACLSGLAGVGAAGSGPLVSGAAAPPGVVAGTLPCTRGRGGDVPVAGPVAGVSVAPGALELGGLVLVCAMAMPAQKARRSAAIPIFMKVTPLLFAAN
jgi:hypothetical protein